MRQRLFLLIPLLLVLLRLPAAAQGTYSFTVSSSPYVDLANAVPIPSDLNPDLGYGVSIPFLFQGFGVPLNFEGSPKPVFVFTGGFVGMNGYANDRLFVIDAFVGRMGQRDETTSLSYRLEGEGENQVLKLQWKNMKLVDNPEGDFANVQLWLFRKDNSFEVHIGPNRATGQAAFSNFTGPAIGAFLSNLDLSQYYATIHLAGDPKDPARETFNAFYPMGGVPTNGTVYRFTYNGESSTVNDIGGMRELRLTPNPASEGFTIALPENARGGRATVVVYDPLGRQVLRSVNLSDGEYISTLGLSPGVYQVVAYDHEEIVLTQRLVVAR